MKLFIIGASGYLGKKLILAGCKLHNIIGTSSQGGDNLLRFNLENPSNFSYELIQTSDVVLLTAAISSPDACAKDYERAWKVNVTETTEFINQVINRGAKVIFFSSDTVYGEQKNDFDESATCNPSGEYAEMKHEVEKLFLDNPLFKSIRLSYVFSKEDKFTKYLLNCSENGEESKIFHPFYRAVIYRDDVISGAIALAQSWNKFPQSVINFGGNEILSRIDFVETVRNIGLLNLRLKVTQPNESFFVNRPRIIKMKSPILPQLLGRNPRSLEESVKIEFNNNLKK